jgi:hypothetical protein
VTYVLFTSSWYFLEDRNLLSFFFSTLDFFLVLLMFPSFFWRSSVILLLFSISRDPLYLFSRLVHLLQFILLFFVLFNLPTIILITTASWEYLYEKREGVLLLLLLLVRINSKLEYIYKREKWLKFCFYYYLLTCLNMIKRNEFVFF